VTIKPQVLAETLFTEYIQRKHCDWYPAAPGATERLPNQLWVPPSAIPALDAKIRLYQFTTVLLAIVNEAHKRPEFNSVREHFERLYFPPSFDFDILWDVRRAMEDLGELLTLEKEDHTNSSAKAGKSMFWARNWLSTAGIEENNPVTLGLFALNWMDYYVAATSSLDGFNPVD
jgi:hypothetical protein